MTSKHTANKFSDAISLRKGKSLYEELIKKYGIEGETFSDQMMALGKHILSHDGVGNSEIECPYGTEHGDHILCAKHFEQKARIHKLPRAFCRQCWERQQREKVESRTTEVQAMKAQIHRYQERVNQTIKEQKENVIICPKTDVVIPTTQCKNCDLTQQKRCQRIMRESDYQRELAKVRTLID